MLRLFNDAAAQFFCYFALLLLLEGCHRPGMVGGKAGTHHTIQRALHLVLTCFDLVRQCQPGSALLNCLGCKKRPTFFKGEPITEYRAIICHPSPGESSLSSGTSTKLCFQDLSNHVRIGPGSAGGSAMWTEVSRGDRADPDHPLRGSSCRFWSDFVHHS